MTVGGVLLLNYWASFQLLSTLTYTGIVAALIGLSNLALPFRFMGVRRRAVGALGLAGGVVLAQSPCRYGHTLPHIEAQEVGR